MIGINKISFYVPEFYLHMQTLAEARGGDWSRHISSLGQEKMSILPPNEDVVTMGANAAYQIIDDEDRKDINLLIFTTESSFDYSKATGIYAHNLLQLNPQCRTLEIKQACYGSTAALRLAMDHVKANPSKKALIIASDIAKYGFNSSGEPTQGCGSMAMIISTDPNIISFDEYCGFLTKDVMDFWRPEYKKEAIVDGKYSTKMYLTSLLETWKIHKEVSGRALQDYQAMCFHLPFSTIADKAYKRLCNYEAVDFSEEPIKASTEYNSIVGNSYTASLYISLISQLENNKLDLAHKKMGLYAYGAGCVAEFFSGQICDNYQNHLLNHNNMLNNRQEINYNTYKEFYNFQYPTDGSKLSIPQIGNAPFTILEIDNHKRIYKLNENSKH